MDVPVLQTVCVTVTDVESSEGVVAPDERKARMTRTATIVASPTTPKSPTFRLVNWYTSSRVDVGGHRPPRVKLVVPRRAVAGKACFGQLASLRATNPGQCLGWWQTAGRQSELLLLFNSERAGILGLTTGIGEARIAGVGATSSRDGQGYPVAGCEQQ